MKQTAVEWLEIELEKLWVQKYLSPITVKPLIEQAKEMEKEQIETAFIKGNEFLPEWNITNVPYINAKQYYKETFKSE